MRRIICISGDAACGKTTAANRVLALLPDWHSLSTGARFREHCRARGLDPQQISELDDEIHRSFDAAVQAELAGARNLVAEARLVGYLARSMPDALRIYCSCSLPVRAARAAIREPEFTAAEHEVRLAARDAADTAKFLRLYGVDYHDPRFYDRILDTSVLGPDEVATAIVEAARESS